MRIKVLFSPSVTSLIVTHGGHVGYVSAAGLVECKAYSQSKSFSSFYVRFCRFLPYSLKVLVGIVLCFKIIQHFVAQAHFSLGERAYV